MKWNMDMKIQGAFMKCIVLCGCLIGFTCLATRSVMAGEHKVTLMFGGKFCEAYLGDVETALKKYHGVKGIDFKSMKGHAIVTVEDGTVKTGQLIDTVNGVKGEGWHCTAQVMR